MSDGGGGGGGRITVKFIAFNKFQKGENYNNFNYSERLLCQESILSRNLSVRNDLFFLNATFRILGHVSSLSLSVNILTKCSSLKNKSTYTPSAHLSKTREHRLKVNNHL